MRLLHRKSKFERMFEPIKNTNLPADPLSRVAHPPKGVKSGLAVVGGLMGVTAASAAVSQLRRRTEGSTGRS